MLLERQIVKLAEAAESLVKTVAQQLPVVDCKQLQNGRTSKRAVKEIEVRILSSFTFGFYSLLLAVYRFILSSFVLIFTSYGSPRDLYSSK